MGVVKGRKKESHSLAPPRREGRAAALVEVMGAFTHLEIRAF